MGIDKRVDRASPILIKLPLPQRVFVMRIRMGGNNGLAGYRAQAANRPKVAQKSSLRINYLSGSDLET